MNIFFHLTQSGSEPIDAFFIGMFRFIRPYRTAIKEYHEHDFNQLLEVLKKNRIKISIDPSDRKTQELLENQFTKSLSILSPLKTRIKATDELIDEIVYRLYGLTEEEIKVVKGAVS